MTRMPNHRSRLALAIFFCLSAVLLPLPAFGLDCNFFQGYQADYIFVGKVLSTSSANQETGFDTESIVEVQEVFNGELAPTIVVKGLAYGGRLVGISDEPGERALLFLQKDLMVSPCSLSKPIHSDDYFRKHPYWSENMIRKHRTEIDTLLNGLRSRQTNKILDQGQKK
jgi:hypothetical protein